MRDEWEAAECETGRKGVDRRCFHDQSAGDRRDMLWRKLAPPSRQMRWSFHSACLLDGRVSPFCLLPALPTRIWLSAVDDASDHMLARIINLEGGRVPVRVTASS